MNHGDGSRHRGGTGGIEGFEPPADPEGLEELLEHLRDSRAIDFTGYKRATLARRIARRLGETGARSYAEYRDVLEADPGEVSVLFNTILINVSGFFRDPEVWDVLRREVVPELSARATPEAPVRVWSAGCADGQEPYSVAMLFAAEVGLDGLRDRVKIYATDVDEEALSTARRATYDERALDGVPPALLDRYFEPPGADGSARSLTPELRRCVIFGRHNVAEDAPISRIDLLLCRNTLMYFNAALQREVVGRLHFSLVPSGYLVLGKVEMLLGHRSLFQPRHATSRIFTKQRGGAAPPAELLPFLGAADDGASGLAGLAVEVGSVAQLVVDRTGQLALVNGAARRQLGLDERDVGRPFAELEVSYRPVELRSRIDEALREGRQVEVRGVQGGRDRAVHFDVLVTPLQHGGEAVAALITFVDVTHHHDLQERLEQAHHDLETAYEELQSTTEELETTNEELQSTNEELETTNEELQSTIEELETTNEELRSTNEEFETMNDELQVVNQELEARNRALRERGAELVAAKAYHQALLDSLEVAVVAVDDGGHVMTWNAGAEELWGVRPEEAVGRTVLSLDIGLPLEQLATPLREVMSGARQHAELVVSAHNRRGRPIRCTVQLSSLGGGGGGVILLMDVDDADLEGRT